MLNICFLDMYKCTFIFISLPPIFLHIHLFILYLLYVYSINLYLHILEVLYDIDVAMEMVCDDMEDNDRGIIYRRISFLLQNFQQGVLTISCLCVVSYVSQYLLQKFKNMS
jgi:hypothetical protein